MFSLLKEVDIKKYIYVTQGGGGYEIREVGFGSPNIFSKKKKKKKANAFGDLEEAVGGFG